MSNPQRPRWDDEPALSPRGVGGTLWYDHAEVGAWVQWAIDKITVLEAENRELRDRCLKLATSGTPVVWDQQVINNLEAAVDERDKTMAGMSETIQEMSARLTEAEELLRDFVDFADEPTAIGGLTETAHAFLSGVSAKTEEGEND